MFRNVTFLITVFSSFTTFAMDLDTAWKCDEDYTEIFWCEKVSGPHDFERMSYCYKTDTMKTASIMPQLVFVRETDEEDVYSREVGSFEKVKEEGFGDQKKMLIHFNSPVIKSEVKETGWTGKYIEYRFAPRLAQDAKTFTHYVYATNHEVTATLRDDGRWSQTDVGFGYGSQNEPNLMKCYTPQ